MEKKLILLFSHNLTRIQIDDAKNQLGITKFLDLPSGLQKLWSNVPPEIETVDGYLNPIREWLETNANSGDYLLVQGDFGATCHFVQWAFANNIIPVYSTTKRIHTEQEHENGDIEIKKSFRHQMFRRYPEK